MVYDTEAVPLTDLGYGAPRVLAYDKARAEKDHQDTLDQLDEARETVLLRSAKYQQVFWWYHNKTFQSEHSRSTTWSYDESKLPRTLTS